LAIVISTNLFGGFWFGGSAWQIVTFPASGRRLCWLSSHALAAISATAITTIRAPGGMRIGDDRSPFALVA
jgi:hypothetical protein